MNRAHKNMPKKEPIFLHMLGIPGAGKTTFLNCLKTRWASKEEPFLLGFDQVMQSLPEYQAMEDKIAAFDIYELPARKAGYLKLDELITERKNILFDNGGSAASHIDILQKAKNIGYTIVLASIKTDISNAQKRVDARAVLEGRHTPMTYINERSQKLADLETNYRALTPYFYEMYNNGKDFDVFQQSCIKMSDIILKDIGQKDI